MPGAGVTIAVSIDCGTHSSLNINPNGFYVTNSLGGIFYYNVASGFEQLPGGAVSLAPTASGGIFALGNPGAAQHGIFYNDLDTGVWTQMPGAAVSLSANTTNVYAIGAAGGIYVSPIVNSSVSSQLAEFPLPSANESPTSVTVGPDNNVWFTELNFVIGEISPGGAETEHPQIASYRPSSASVLVSQGGTLWWAAVNGTVGGANPTAGVDCQNGYLVNIAAGPANYATVFKNLLPSQPEGILYAIQDVQYNPELVGIFQTNAALLSGYGEDFVGFAYVHENLNWLTAGTTTGVAWATAAGLIYAINLPAGTVQPYLLAQQNAMPEQTLAPHDLTSVSLIGTYTEPNTFDASYTYQLPGASTAATIPYNATAPIYPGGLSIIGTSGASGGTISVGDPTGSLGIEVDLVEG